jgi:stalled ribosome rescue protein Dom34
MNTYILWIEMDVAKIFKIQAGPRTSKILKRREIKHHTSRDPENHKDCERFFHDVARALKNADEIYLVGPGLAKEHFKAHLKRHHHSSLALNVVGTETADHISDARILALSRKFFRSYDQFGAALYDARKQNPTA